MKNLAAVRVLVAPVVAGAVAGMLILWMLASAMHGGAPHSLRVGVVAPDQALSQVSAALDQKEPGAFSIVRYTTADEARAAVDSRDVAGAVVFGNGTMEIKVASGNGPASANAIGGAFSAIAQATGAKPTVTDLRPMSSTDPIGIVPFFLVLTVSLSGLICGLVALMLGGRPSLMTRLGAMVVFAIVSGFLAAGMVGFVGTFDASLWPLSAICMLLALSVAVTTLALQRLVGVAGTGLSALCVVVLGVATSGGMAGPAFLNDGFRELAGILPPSAALSAARGALYFDGAGIYGPCLSLAAWIVVAGAALVAAERWMAPRAMALPRPQPEAI
jgi:hypothetical protein